MKYTQILIIWFYLLSVLWGFAAPWHPSLITQSSSVPLLYYQVYLQFKVCTMQEAETGLGLCCWNHWRDSEEPKEMRNQRVKVALTPSHLWSSSILGPRCIPGGMRGMWPLSHGKSWNSRIIQVGTGLQDLRAQAVMISTPLAARRCHGAAHLFPWNFSLPSSQSCLSAGFHCQEAQHWNGKGDEVQWAVKPSSGCAQRTGNNSNHWSSCWLLLCSSWSFLSVLSLNHNLCAVLFRPLSCGCSTACSCLWGRWWWHPRQTAFCIFFPAGLRSYFLSILIFMCITPPRTPESWWSTSSSLLPEPGKGQPQTQRCLCPLPVSRRILFPPLPSELALYSPTRLPCSSHLAAPSPGLAGAPWFLLPPLRLLSPNFHTVSVTSPVAAASSALQCSWYHFPLFPRGGVSISPGHHPCSLLLFTFSPCFAPSLSSPQPGLCPEH